MRKRLYLLLAFLWMGVCMLSAQTKNVSGRILSAENDEPIAGATVLVKGTSIGVVSDAHGHFTLKVPESATELIVSFIGMETQEVGIKANLTIRLKSANEKLDEVMVVAYGTAKKSSFTGAAEVTKNEQLEKMNVVSVTKALEGTSPGLQVMGGTGQPGSGATVRIRGIGSLSSSSAPLYVLNGVVFDGDISSINPDDIESISVLKDAASAALYGARGANGDTDQKGKCREVDAERQGCLGIFIPCNSRIFQNRNKGLLRDFLGSIQKCVGGDRTIHGKGFRICCSQSYQQAARRL